MISARKRDREKEVERKDLFAQSPVHISLRRSKTAQDAVLYVRISSNFYPLARVANPVRKYSTLDYGP